MKISDLPRLEVAGFVSASPADAKRRCVAAVDGPVLADMRSGGDADAALAALFAGAPDLAKAAAFAVRELIWIQEALLDRPNEDMIRKLGQALGRVASKLDVALSSTGVEGV